ncbi:MAG: hypothetical protein IJO87_10505 [Eggerthellaceae bacterium]|nr:hypothetical protein [Eggerthellaceae bacterium]
MAYNIQSAAEMRKALQIFLASMDPETQAAQMLEVSTVFPSWQVGKAYKAKEVFAYGVNGVGDPQLYMTIANVTADATHPPDVSISQYKPIGVTEDGYPEWVQPLGDTDAYVLGDIVSHNGQLWICTQVNGGVNAYEPGVWGWEVYEG